MAMSPSDSGGSNSPLAEINVTPLVDVMLVLLVIFMIASGVESAAVEQELERLKAETVEEEEPPPRPDEHPSQKVPVDLPQVNSEKVNLTEEQKLVLSMDTDFNFFLGDTKFLSCPDVKGGLSKKTDEAFKVCLGQLEEKLVENQKLREDQELYLRADKAIDYGRVLGVMARVRKAGVTKFGLVADAEVEAE